MNKLKTANQMERHLKGMANHYRIEVLLLIGERPGLSLEDIIAAIGANDRTIAEHTRRLQRVGLVSKKYRGRYVEHALTPYGKIFFRFLKSFQET